MLIHDLVTAMETIAPLDLAEAWDKVGLLAGDPSRELAGPVLLTIDLTEAVLDEAIGYRAGAIIAYHPPIFSPLSRLTDATVTERIARRAIESRIALYSPHTALDNVQGGVTDWLCEGLSGGDVGRIAGDCRALIAATDSSTAARMKVVTFVPAKDADRVREALASAGAGIIGDYTLCSFSTPGVGTFLGGEGSKPVVGEAGRLERVEELRLEMVCSKRALPLALETLRAFHPYSEPAIDVYELVAQPKRSHGAGRRLVLDRPATLRDLAARLRTHLVAHGGFARVEIADAHRDRGGDANRELTKIGVCPGSGAALAAHASSSGCEVFVTGEMKHHDVLAMVSQGVSVILAGHTNTERGYLSRLADRLGELCLGVEIKRSVMDKDPLVVG